MIQSMMSRVAERGLEVRAYVDLGKGRESGVSSKFESIAAPFSASTHMVEWENAKHNITLTHDVRHRSKLHRDRRDIVRGDLDSLGESTRTR